jgi:hypothetical protein
VRPDRNMCDMTGPLGRLPIKRSICQHGSGTAWFYNYTGSRLENDRRSIMLTRSKTTTIPWRTANYQKAQLYRWELHLAALFGSQPSYPLLIQHPARSQHQDFAVASPLDISRTTSLTVQRLRFGKPEGRDEIPLRHAESVPSELNSPFRSWERAGKNTEER